MNKEFKEWLERQVETTENNTPNEYNVHTHIAQIDILEKYNELHKPVAIPNFVAEWIEENREQYENNFFSIGRDLYDICIHPDVSDWLMENEEKFVRAWFGRYEIKDEQLYYALVKGHKLSSDELKYWNCEAYNLGHLFIGRKEPESRCINRMTKKNWGICGINDSNADFIEIEEMTE